MRGELIVHEDPKSPISEIFRTLRTNIQFTYTKNSLKTILITSTLSGEGKSWVSSNLAVTFAQAGKRVILVDADMRKGRQYTIFNASPRPGLSNYLSGLDDSMNAEASDDLRNYIQETEVEGLYLMAAGNIPPNPSELLASDQMENLLNQLKQMFDIILIDGTPNQLVTDSLILARMVDSTVIVTASNQTKKEDLKRMVKNIKNVGGKIAGVIVNKLPISAKKYSQSYYYGSTSMAKTKPTINIRSLKKTEIEEKSEEKIKEAESEKDSEVIKENIKGYREENSQGELEEKNYQIGCEEEKDSNLAEEGYIKEPFNNEINPNNENRATSENSTGIIDETLLNRKIEVEAPNVSLEKTADILRQVNEYLENEKKKLN